MAQSNAPNHQQATRPGPRQRAKGNARRPRTRPKNHELTDEERTELDELWLRYGIHSASKRRKLVGFVAVDQMFADTVALDSALQRLASEFAKVGGPSDVLDVAEMVTLQPRILTNYVPESLAEKMRDFLIIFNRRDDAVRVVKREPQVLFLRSDSVAERLDELQEIIPHADAKSIVLKHPRLLSVRPRDRLAMKVDELYGTLGAFGVSEEEVQRLVEQHPSILLLKASERMYARLKYVDHWAPGLVRQFTAALPLVLKVSEIRLQRIAFVQECYPSSRWTLTTLLHRSERQFNNMYPGFNRWLKGNSCATEVELAMPDANESERKSLGPGNTENELNGDKSSSTWSEGAIATAESKPT